MHPSRKRARLTSMRASDVTAETVCFFPSAGISVSEEACDEASELPPKIEPPFHIAKPCLLRHLSIQTKPPA